MDAVRLQRQEVILMIYSWSLAVCLCEVPLAATVPKGYFCTDLTLKPSFVCRNLSSGTGE